jgi:hypothetical protein
VAAKEGEADTDTDGEDLREAGRALAAVAARADTGRGREWFEEGAALLGALAAALPALDDEIARACVAMVQVTLVALWLLSFSALSFFMLSFSSLCSLPRSSLLSFSFPSPSLLLFSFSSLSRPLLLFSPFSLSLSSFSLSLSLLICPSQPVVTGLGDSRVRAAAAALLALLARQRACVHELVRLPSGLSTVVTAVQETTQICKVF